MDEDGQITRSDICVLHPESRFLAWVGSLWHPGQFILHHPSTYTLQHLVVYQKSTWFLGFSSPFLFRFHSPMQKQDERIKHLLYQITGGPCTFSTFLVLSDVPLWSLHGSYVWSSLNSILSITKNHLIEGQYYLLLALQVEQVPRLHLMGLHLVGPLGKSLCKVENIFICSL